MLKVFSGVAARRDVSYDRQTDSDGDDVVMQAHFTPQI